jgi:vancomycin permeability regulator SanA
MPARTALVNALRGAALFLACFSAANVLLSLRWAGGDPNLWWLDVRAVPRPFAIAFHLAVTVALFVVILSRSRSRVRVAASVIVIVAAAIALANAATFSALLARGEIVSRLPIPLSLGFAMLLAAAVVPTRDMERRWPAIAIGFAISLLLFPIAQIVAIGTTDYRRPADVIVVFGARAYANGTASSALRDRVRASCELYRAGLAPKMLFSGGPGDGAIDEPHAMQLLAVKLGVPAEAIVLDPNGINTDATARNTCAIFGDRPLRVIAVSHFYHLPRIRLAYQRVGLTAWTVSSGTSQRSHLFYNVPRESIAFWAYYLRAFVD